MVGAGSSPAGTRLSCSSTASPAPPTTSLCVADDLAADRRVVPLDQRGHGHSTKTGRLEGYTIDQLVGRPRRLPRGGR